MGYQMVDIGDAVELAVETSGNGPIDVVFLHGYSLSGETWRRAIPFFPDSLYTRHAYDQRGFGRSRHPETGYTQLQHAIDLGRLMDRLGIEKAVLIGHSLGGAIAQEFTVMHPERVAALVSCDAFARFRPLPGADDEKRSRARAIGTPGKNREILEGAVKRYLDPRNCDRDSVDKFLDITLRASPKALHDQLLDAYEAPTLDAAKYAALTIPVMAVTGSTDHVAPYTEAFALTDQVPGSELAVIPRTGHSPMWEAPQDFCRPVLDFLERRLG